MYLCNIMKKILKTGALLLLVAFAFNAKIAAQTPCHLLNNSGALYTFTLEENPRFWHSGGLLYIHTNNSKVIFVKNKISQIFWDCDLPTSIEETVENRIKFNVEKDRLNISGNPDSTIRIYSIKGILCAEVQPTGEDNMNIDVTNLERGTYIVKISDFTFKFLKQ